MKRVQEEKRVPLEGAAAQGMTETRSVDATSISTEWMEPTASCVSGPGFLLRLTCSCLPGLCDRLQMRNSACAEWAEVPVRLQSTAAFWTPASHPSSAFRTDEEIDTRRVPAAGADGANFLDFGYDAQEFIG